MQPAKFLFLNSLGALVALGQATSMPCTKVVSTLTTEGIAVEVKLEESNVLPGEMIEPRIKISNHSKGPILAPDLSSTRNWHLDLYDRIDSPDPNKVRYIPRAHRPPLEATSADCTIGATRIAAGTSLTWRLRDELDDTIPSRKKEFSNRAKSKAGDHIAALMIGNWSKPIYYRVLPIEREEAVCVTFQELGGDTCLPLHLYQAGERTVLAINERPILKTRASEWIAVLRGESRNQILREEQEQETKVRLGTFPQDLRFEARQPVLPVDGVNLINIAAGGERLRLADLLTRRLRK